MEARVIDLEIARQPRPPELKYQTPQTAVKHGLTKQVVVMPAEEIEAFEAHFKSFRDEYNPKGATEKHMVQLLADIAFRMDRLSAIESNLLLTGHNEIEVDPNMRRAALCTADLFLKPEYQKALATLSTHGQRLHRQYERTIKILREMQEKRKREEAPDLGRATDIAELYEKADKAYNPAMYGFVFTPEEMKAERLRRERERLPHKAWCIKNGVEGYAAEMDFKDEDIDGFFGEGTAKRPATVDPWSCHDEDS
jgi:hypothetical protein